MPTRRAQRDASVSLARVKIRLDAGAAAPCAITPQRHACSRTRRRWRHIDASAPRGAGLSFSVHSKMVAAAQRAAPQRNRKRMFQSASPLMRARCCMMFVWQICSACTAS